MKRTMKMVAMGTLGFALAAGLAMAGKRKFTAVCNTTHGLAGSWWGEDRDTRADAEADAEAHKKSWAGHTPDIWDRVD